MNDLISRQAVLEATSTILKITGKENAETVYEYIKKLCDDIKALPSARQWIPWVENDDRLKDHYYYLVNHVWHEIPMLAKFHDDGCYFEIISMYPHKSIYVWDNDIITAWMPLPEIYKGEE